MTGGGVTAGIDFALALVAELAGVETAQAIQLQLEYSRDAPQARRGGQGRTRKTRRRRGAPARRPIARTAAACCGLKAAR
jgi:cyclohexyl-isocyanide hydratase